MCSDFVTFKLGSICHFISLYRLHGLRSKWYVIKKKNYVYVLHFIFYFKKRGTLVFHGIVHLRWKAEKNNAITSDWQELNSLKHDVQLCMYT